jgi:glycosyltransferase involved in cell wall biosynthesis
LEVIVVDDGSTDDTRSVAKPFLSDARTRYILRPNGGQAKAKNEGVHAATGDVVAFLDADDAWAPDKLARQLPLFDDPAVGVVYSGVSFMDAEGKDSARPPEVLPMFRGDVLKPLLSDNFVPFSSSVVRRPLLGDAPFDEALSMSIDWDLWLRLSLGAKFDYVDAPLLRYREGHPGQMSKNLLERQACCDRIFERFSSGNAARLDPRDVRDARVYTYNNRGYFFRSRDPRRALDYYKRSWSARPWQWAAAKGMVLSLAGAVFGGGENA